MPSSKRKIIATLMLCVVLDITLAMSIPAVLETSAIDLTQQDEQQIPSIGTAALSKVFPTSDSGSDTQDSGSLSSHRAFDQDDSLTYSLNSQKKESDGITKLKTGYSKVSKIVSRQDEHLEVDAYHQNEQKANEATDINVSRSNGSSASGSNKSNENSAAESPSNVVERITDDKEEDDIYGAEIIVPSVGDIVKINPSASIKDSLTSFMRKHLYNSGVLTKNAEDSSNLPQQQPIAAKLTIDDDSEMSRPAVHDGSNGSINGEIDITLMHEEMKRRISDFVEKFMGGVLKAEIHGVRVEHRANGLQDYRSS